MTKPEMEKIFANEMHMTFHLPITALQRLREITTRVSTFGVDTDALDVFLSEHFTAICNQFAEWEKSQYQGRQN